MQVYGRYQLFERLALGGMAELFLARSASLDGFEKDFVIKRIRAEYAEDEQLRSMFLDEARISMSLTHPHIVQVFDFGECDGSYFLAMEYVDGCDLRRLLRLPGVKNQGLEPSLAIMVLSEVLEALDYAHNKNDRNGQPLNIVHRDISPHNVLVSFEGQVKLTDFGIAKARRNLSQTHPGMVIGKFAYMAPEQLCQLKVDGRTDLFACGVILWELLTGSSLFAGSNRARSLEAMLEVRVDPPSIKQPRITPALDAIVLRALARSPEDRFGSARELERALHAYLVEHHPDASPYDLGTFMAEQRQALLAITEVDDDAGEAEDVDPGTAVADVREFKPVRVSPAPLASGAALELSPELCAIVDAFRARPSLWQFVSMAQQCFSEKRTEAAAACYRVAALKFAQRGLLAQAMLCSRRLCDLVGPESVRADLCTLPRFVGSSDAAVLEALKLGGDPVEQLLSQLVEQAHTNAGTLGRPTPLLALLDGQSLAELALEAPLKHFEDGEAILREGQGGRTMYLLGRGRVIVFATTASGTRVSLSSLFDGDFFGENGFFTGTPRSATVEATGPVDAFEIDRALFNAIAVRHPEASGILLEFYRERIAEAVMAKSVAFGLLPAEDRRALVQDFMPRVFSDGEHVIEEGKASDAIYLVKDGSAEVVTFKEGERTLLSVIGPATLFGEVAALRGIPRTATVVARGRLEVLELPAQAFLAVLDKRPDVKKLVLQELGRRVRDNIDKILGAGLR